MANESWEEVRYYVLGQLPELNRKVDGLENKLNSIETKFEAGMAVIGNKVTTIVALGSTAMSVVVSIIFHFWK